MTALHEIDEKNRRMAELHETAEENRKTELDGEVPEAGFTARMYRKNPRRMQIYQALDLPYREMPLDEAVGKMAADYVYLYPPEFRSSCREKLSRKSLSGTSESAGREN